MDVVVLLKVIILFFLLFFFFCEKKRKRNANCKFRSGLLFEGWKGNKSFFFNGNHKGKNIVLKHVDIFFPFHLISKNYLQIHG